MAASRFPCWLLTLLLSEVLLFGAVRSVENNRLGGTSDNHLFQSPKKQFCVSTYCSGLFDRDLKICYQLFCGKDSESEEYTDCILDNCNHQIGFLRKVCIYEKCRKNKGGMDQGKMGVGEVWSGELSAPQSSMADYETSASARNVNGLWYPDFEKVLERGNLDEMESGASIKSCESKCKENALNGEGDYEACFLANCKGVSNVGKRWSTRMCMESHCKSANNKVQYFLCGKQHCHK